MKVSTLGAAIRLVHPAPAAAVVALSAALGAILATRADGSIDGRLLATVAAVAGSQVFTGALNDLVDRVRDQVAARLDKPLAAGELSPEAAAWIASGGLALQLAASLQLDPLALWLGLLASGSAFAYNVWLSRTPWSVVPYLVSFGVLPLWVAAGVGVPLERVLPAVPLVAPFAAAAHLANVTRDFDLDAAGGSRNLAQLLGRTRSQWLAYGTGLAVGVGVGLVLLLGGRPTFASGAAWGLGMVAVAQAGSSPRRLWYGLLLAAIAWATAWAVTTT